jgi:hypothetical protein
MYWLWFTRILDNLLSIPSWESIWKAVFTASKKIRWADRDVKIEIGMLFKRETAEDIQIAPEDHGGGHWSIVPWVGCLHHIRKRSDRLAEMFR